MPMEENLVARLVALGTAAGSKVSWAAPQRGDQPPYIVLNQVSHVEDWSHDGPDGLDQARVQADCYARKDTDALALARAVKAEMQRLTPVTVGSTTFHPAELADQDMTDEGEQDGGARLFHVRHDFIFYHEET